MSSRIPEYSRYVSSITITNGGSGYGTGTTIEISGGGGTGATATASVFNGIIQTVTITDEGSGYTTSPTVTVTGGGGSGAVLVAVLSFAALPTTEYQEISSLGIKYTLPEFIREDYPDFVTFLEKYYEFMDQTNNPGHLLLNKRYYDIDDLNDAELNKKALEFAKDFPQVLAIEKKKLFKNIKSLYESKGSERSIKAFFRLVYDEEIEISYPTQFILRASDGIWQQDNSVKVLLGYEDHRPTNLYAKAIDIVYYETVRYFFDENGDRRADTEPKRISTAVVRANKIAYTTPSKYELFLELPRYVTSIPGPGAGAAATLTIVGGVITAVTLTSGGSGYLAAPDVIITSTGSGVGADIVAIVENGSVTEFIINNGGSSYVSGTTTISFDTNEYRTVILLKDVSIIEENIKGYLTRCLTSVTSGSYVGADAGFKVGDVFSFAQTENDLSYFTVKEVDEDNVPTSWTILAPGSGYTSASTTDTITSDTGETLQITLNSDYLFAYDGNYKNDRGKLSSLNILQDNFKFQNYSYIIKSSLPQYIWNDVFREHMHPAGKEVFGDLFLISDLDISIVFSTTGLNLNEFITEDLTDASDVLVVSFSTTRADSTTNSDTFTISIESFFTDSVSAAEIDFQDYGPEDYFPEAYTGIVAILKTVEKSLLDSSITSDVASINMSWNKTFTDPFGFGTNPSADDTVVIEYNVLRSFEDSTTAINDIAVIEMQWASSLEDSTTAIDDIVVIETTRSLEDSTTAIDDIAVIEMQWASSLEDSTTAIDDIVVIETARSIADSTTEIDDIVVIETARSFEDSTVAINDIAVIETTWTRSLEDSTTAINDIAVIEMEWTSSFEDSTTEIDDIAVIETTWTRSFEDSTTAIDDIAVIETTWTRSFEDSTTEIDDTVAIETARSIADSTTEIDDIVVIETARSIADSTTEIDDTVAIETASSFEDATAAADIDSGVQDYGPEDYFPEGYTGIIAIIKNVEKSLLDSSTTSDVASINMSWNKTFTEPFGFGTNPSADDIAVIETTRSFEDSTTAINDNAVIETTRSFEDSTTAIDEIAILRGKSFEDSTTAIDDIAVIEMEWTRSFEDSTTAIDGIAIIKEIDFEDSATASDSGSITLLNYIDPTYFSEDYVGEVTNIT
jgi:hypothetical protein